MVYMTSNTKDSEKTYWRLARKFFIDGALAEDRAFCPTGSGGGVDNSCGSGKGGKGGAAGGDKSGTPKGRANRPERVPTRKPSKSEVQLASQDGDSPRQIAARKVVASHFMHSKGAFLDRKTGKLKPLDRQRFEGQMKAIDWSKPVKVGPPPELPPPSVLVQWQAPGNIPPAGGYFSTEGTEPEQLGIGRKGTAWKSEGQPVVDKIPYTFEVQAAPQYLQSYASPAVDTWSTKDSRPQAANGGGVQYFVPDAQATGGIDEFKLKGGKRRSVRSLQRRKLTISIDFDRTFAADPALWGEFAAEAVGEGNKVVMVSRREDTPENQAYVAKSLGKWATSFSRVLLVGTDKLKDAAAKDAGIKVDIWVDDAPQTVKGSA
jgi:hypothetical protein